MMGKKGEITTLFEE
ncbi:MAG: hypothetical protein RSC07_05700, partial [Mucinivorans sp.]